MPTEDLNIGDKFTAKAVDEESEFVVHSFIVDKNDEAWILCITENDGVPYLVHESDVDDTSIYTSRVPNLYKNPKKKGMK